MSRLGRKKAKFHTIAKTYMFFEEDIKIMLNKGWTPKEVFRLGIYAKLNNPQLINRVSDNEVTVDALSNKLQAYARKVFTLEDEVTKLKEELKNRR